MRPVMMAYYVLIGLLGVALFLLVANAILSNLLNVQVIPK